MEALPAQDRAKDVRDLDLRHETLPAQRSLGVLWNLEDDELTFKVSIPEKPFTRRGVLSIVNSIYNPMGLAVPVTLKGKLLLQQLVIMGKGRNDHPLGWDDPLPDDLMHQWRRWKDSLPDLENVSLARCLHPKHFGQVIRTEIHAFSDASKDAIGTAAYLRLVNDKKEVHVAFLFGQSRVAPAKSTSIPRLELCGAVLATQAVRKIIKEMDMEVDEVVFYTDSKVALGYIQNESRRFYVYVANRVQIIRNVSEPHQWRFVDTEDSPADLATRGIDASKLNETQWLEGPLFLRQIDAATSCIKEEIALNESDPEVRREITTNSTTIRTDMGTERLSRFSSWSSLRRAIAILIAKARDINGSRNQDQQTDSHRNKYGLLLPTVKELDQATTVLLKMVQGEAFADEIKVLGSIPDRQVAYRERIRGKKNALKKSRLYHLDPFIDEDGILRVGGRLRRSSLDFVEKHPAVLPKDHHLSELLIRHHHGAVHHQGRQITHGAVRQAGYWIISGHSAVTRVLDACVTCKKARGAIIIIIIIIIIMHFYSAISV